MSKPHIDLHIIYKTSAKFKKDRDKTVGGVAFTKYPLVYEMLKMMFTRQKKRKNYLIIKTFYNFSI